MLSLDGVYVPGDTPDALRERARADACAAACDPGDRGRPGRPRRFPDAILGDRAYDSEALRRASRDRRIRPRLAKRNTPHGSGLGAFRWPVERTISWLHRFRRLGYRRDRLLPIHEAFLTLGCALIAFRFL